MKKFGEIFHNGEIINLERTKNAELGTVVIELRNTQKKLKIDIDECLEKMKSVR